MNELNERLKKHIKNCVNLKDLTYASIASFCDCSADQVRRRVSNDVKERKDEIRKAKTKHNSQKQIKDKSNGSELSSVLKRLEKIESNIEIIKAELSSKDKPNPWVAYLPCGTPKDQLVDVKVNGSIITGEFCYIEENYICFSEAKDVEWDRIDRRHDAGLLTDEQADNLTSELDEREPYDNEYTEIRISNRQSSQLEKKLNRIIRALNA